MPFAKTPRSRSADALLVSLLGYSFADLAAELSLTLVVVVGSRLGALNQTLLMLECAEQRGFCVAGYAMNQLTPDEDLAQRPNPTALAALTDARGLGSIPYLDEAARADRRRLAEVGRPIAASLRGTDEA
jgi:dethiobiotin synthetase